MKLVKVAAVVFVSIVLVALGILGHDGRKSAADGTDFKSSVSTGEVPTDSSVANVGAPASQSVSAAGASAAQSPAEVLKLRMARARTPHTREGGAAEGDATSSEAQAAGSRLWKTSLANRSSGQRIAREALKELATSPFPRGEIISQKPRPNGETRTKERLADGGIVKQTLDPNGTLLHESMRLESGESVSRTFTADGSSRTIVRYPEGGKSSVVTDPQGIVRKVTETAPNGSKQVIRYDSQGNEKPSHKKPHA